MCITVLKQKNKMDIFYHIYCSGRAIMVYLINNVNIKNYNKGVGLCTT